MMTGIPVKRMVQAETEKLRKMADDMREMVVGQDEAIGKVVRAIQRNRVGLKDPKKPIGTFIFLGPTGVGKTELARALARYMFDSEDALIRMDMSEYMEKFTVSRLIGAPPGYVGYEEGGQLTEKVRRKPYSVILLDEIEKAHPDIYNILLQVLDDGQLTDGLGRKVNFKNTTIIMTSNIGVRQLKEFGDGVGFATAARIQNQEENNKAVIEKALKRTFSPEFLNRVDDIVIFNSLNQEHIFQIIDILMRGVLKRLANLGFSLELTEAAKKFLAEKGYDSQFGARPLHRAIQKYLEDPLAEEILNMNLKQGDILIADADDENGKLKFNFKKKRLRQMFKQGHNKLKAILLDGFLIYVPGCNSTISFTCARSYKNDSGRMLQRLVFSPVKLNGKETLSLWRNYHREGAICNRDYSISTGIVGEPGESPGH